ncbi:hypothetical protein [Anianabacter salinae]|uniref:hypothetical protein n=1 Tax=Anianabacter salinae TaxID=2851023 RepID=UPI00225DD735|nr:hypothetical protein [Anianabacter salinae]MBV0910830.1 hypothetical protein [Anianabacter salinae]
MFRLIPLIALLALAAPAHADARNTQLESLVANEIDTYVDGVDVADLSNGQLATIYSIMHGGRSESDKRAMIRSAIGGRNTLRGLLFN